MFKRLTLLWTLMRGEARALWRALRHPDTPSWFKLGAALIVLYVASPVDLIPDFIPFVGAIDDVLVLTFGVRWLLSRLPAHIAADVRSASRKAS
jgi:uncharacterized membrane protein YkvA (DUF1232 family)